MSVCYRIKTAYVKFCNMTVRVNKDKYFLNSLRCNSTSILIQEISKNYSTVFVSTSLTEMFNNVNPVPASFPFSFIVRSVR